MHVSQRTQPLQKKKKNHKNIFEAYEGASFGSEAVVTEGQLTLDILPMPLHP